MSTDITSLIPAAVMLLLSLFSSNASVAAKLFMISTFSGFLTYVAYSGQYYLGAMALFGVVSITLFESMRITSNDWR
jgi:hypothetical protein